MPNKCCKGKEVVTPPGPKHRRCIFKTESVPLTLYKDQDLEEAAEKNKKKKCDKKLENHDKPEVKDESQKNIENEQVAGPSTEPEEPPQEEEKEPEEAPA